jgi:methylaspartate ammonia-lyase
VISSAPSAAGSRATTENAADEWRAYRDISDELPVFCPECAEREFGVDAL